MNTEKKTGKNQSVMQLLELKHELFSTLLAIFLLLLLAEIIWENRISEILKINYLLIIVIATGAFSVLTKKEEEEKTEKAEMTSNDYLYIGASGIAGTFIVWYKIKDIGNLAYLISVIAGALIIILSLLLFEEEDIDG